MDYAGLITAVSTLTAIDPTDTQFLAIFPSAIDYAENRITRELDMLVADVRDSGSSTIALNRDFSLPTTLGVFQVVTAVNVVTPASTAPGSGMRNQLVPVSQFVLDATYPSTTGAGVPQFYCYMTQSSLAGQANILLGPWPDDTYRVEVVGKIIPASLSASNTSTFISLYLPDLLLAAVMVFMTGYMQNWGAQADDPRQGLSWESQYQALKSSAETWEARKHFSAASWTSLAISPVAVPQRG